jgi:hypothetical protein
MDIDQASVFLAGSILTCLGFVVITIAILTVNNLVAKFWKPIKLLRFEDIPHPIYQAQEPVVGNTTVTTTTMSSN